MLAAPGNASSCSMRIAPREERSARWEGDLRAVAKALHVAAQPPAGEAIRAGAGDARRAVEGDDLPFE